MLPRPRTILLLLGVVILLFGVNGLLRQTMAAIDPGLGVYRQSFLIDWFYRAIALIKDHSIWALSLLVSAIPLGLAAFRFKSIGLKVAFYILSAAIALMAMTIIGGWLTHVSLAHWSVVLMFGFGICLLVTLYNSDELTERWISVVSRAAFVMGGVVTVMFVFYCYAIHVRSSEEAIVENRHKSDDSKAARELIDRYLESDVENQEIGKMLSRSADLINSNREISLKMGRFWYDAILDSRRRERERSDLLMAPDYSTQVDSNQIKKRSYAPLVRRDDKFSDHLSVIFPKPRRRVNRQRWESVSAELKSSGPNFDSALEHCLFGNEDLRKNVPYSTYLKYLRRERLPVSTEKIYGTPNGGFRGTVADLKDIFRTFSMAELDSLPPHCEIFYVSEKDAEAADQLVRNLRAHFDGRDDFELIVPKPQLFVLPADSKDSGLQLAIFARGGDVYRRRVEALAKFLGAQDIPGFEGRVGTNGDFVRGLTSMTHSDFVDYSSLETYPLRMESSRLGVYREKSTISVLTEYGEPENHFEIWLIRAQK